ncbi:ImmA/IrrE family metallo-endopeptidase [Microbacterium suaedae]|uniref:ImmA/IrrE family metallo-endopeptidase n=1 Tax=Microbacterium suaedae TaxID=2067813 RepID=UPI001E476B7E|nr:ImmA/IrrE family metallo-endopeptidase [Microbacterium suaedae]
MNTHDDSLAGQFFTFLHELGHILRAETALDNADPCHHGRGGAEAWCNAFAAEALVPAADLRAHFVPVEAPAEEAKRLSARYQCSPLVILLRLRELQLIGSTGFNEVYGELELDVVDRAQAERATRSGGDFYRNLPYRSGERLSRAVIADVRGGDVSYTEAFRLLGLRSATQIDEYARHLGLS